MSKSNDVVVLTAGLGGVGEEEEEGVSMVDGAVCGAVHWWYGCVRRQWNVRWPPVEIGWKFRLP